VKPVWDSRATIQMSRTTPLLIQVVPQLKPGRCGVTDHAIPLANELRSAFGIDSAFVVLNSNERCDLPYEVIYCEPAQLLASCAAHSNGRPAAVLAHVSGYGYSSDGAPALLADALAAVSADGRYPIAAFFHEISASGAPWTAAFWHSHRQQNAIRKIAEVCDLVVTNLAVHADWLERETSRKPGTPIRVLPVLSTIGETRERIPLAARSRAMAVFGLPGTRRRAFRELSRLAALLRALEITEIVDIGAGTGFPDTIDGIPVHHRGELSSRELAAELSHVAFGFLSYPANCLAKSSIFAAYCAHGAIPVIADPFAGEFDGLRDGAQLLSPKTAAAVLVSGLDGCSQQAWRWYAGHGIRIHAETYAQWLSQPALPLERQEARR
jgi:hypothetical protein